MVARVFSLDGVLATVQLQRWIDACSAVRSHQPPDSFYARFARAGVQAIDLLLGGTPAPGDV